MKINEFHEKDKASLYNAFDVFALPSEEKSFGSVYLEAWLAKKLVIASRIGSTQCVIQDGVDGLLSEHRSYIDLGNKLIDLLSHPERRYRMGEQGYNKTVDSFTWPKIVEKVERLFLELKPEKPSPKE